MNGRTVTVGAHPRTFSEANLAAGALIGVVAAVVMGVFSVASGGLLLVPAVALLQTGAAENASGLMILTGLLVHLGVGAIFGMIFSIIYTYLTPKYSLATGIPLGIIYGVVVYLLSFAVIGQALQLGLLTIPAIWAVSSHVVFGFVVGFYPALAAKE